MEYTVLPFGPRNSVLGSAIHDARAKETRITEIALIWYLGKFFLRINYS
jgi:hypothetical protein